jgi:hypothetical protein
VRVTRSAPGKQEALSPRRHFPLLHSRTNLSLSLSLTMFFNAAVIAMTVDAPVTVFDKVAKNLAPLGSRDGSAFQMRASAAIAKCQWRLHSGKVHLPQESAS